MNSPSNTEIVFAGLLAAVVTVLFGQQVGIAVVTAYLMFVSGVWRRLP